MDEQTLAYLRRVDELANSGAVFVVKLDGGREDSGNSRRYTVAATGGPLGPNEAFRQDGDILNDLLEQAIAHFLAYTESRTA